MSIVLSAHDLATAVSNAISTIEKTTGKIVDKIKLDIPNSTVEVDLAPNDFLTSEDNED